MRALIIVSVTALLLAGPALADWRSDAQTLTWFRTAPEGSAAAATLTDFPAALHWWTEQQASPLFAGLLTSARVRVVTASGTVELSITLPRAAGEELITAWAPRCGWDEESPHLPREHVDRQCLSAGVRDLVTRYRQALAAPPPAAEPIAEPLVREETVPKAERE